MTEIDGFADLVSQLAKAEKLTSKIDEHLESIAKNATSASKALGGVSGGGGKGTAGTHNSGQRGNGSGTNILGTAMPNVRDGQGQVLRSPMLGLPTTKWGTRAAALGDRMEQGLSAINSSALGRFATSGGQFFSGTVSALPAESQARISSSMYGISDTLSLMKGLSSASSNFFSPVADTMQRATSYYQAGIYGGNRLTRSALESKTFGGLKGGITSAGADARVASFLAGRGMSASSDAYMQTLAATRNAGRYMNISNEEASQSIEGMTSAKGAAETLRNFGIYTADLATGKEKSQGQIFEELAQRLTAGRGQASVEQTQASIRRGALGVTIESFFKGDQQGAQMFKQYMVERAGSGKTGQSMTSAWEQGITSSAGNKNPLAAQMVLAEKQTNAMGAAEPEYLKGINSATGALAALTDASAGLVKAFGSATAMIQTLFGNKQFSGLTEGLGTMVDFASKGISGIGTALMGMDALNPVPALTEAGLIAGSMAGSLAVAGAGTLGAIVASQSGPGGGSGGGSTVGGFNSGTTLGGTGGGTGDGVAAGSQGPMFDIGLYTRYRVTTKMGVVDSEHPHGHNGTDYGIARGTPIKAAADGKVASAIKGITREGNASDGYGNHVILYHQTSDGKKYTTLYAHLKTVAVSAGQIVKKGDVLGTCGSTGHSTGPHLHLEINEGWGINHSKRIDPSKAAQILTDGGTLTADSGSSSSAASLAVDKAMKQGSEMMKMPAKAQNALAILQGLYSGKEANIKEAVSMMGKNLGIDTAGLLGDMNKSTDEMAGPTSGSTVSPGDASSGRTIKNNVSITVQVPDVTSADALKFAQMVKGYLDDSSLQSNTGGI